MIKSLRFFLYIFLLCLTASAAQAFEFPTVPVFKPTPDDLSVWYLGNIFGSDLVPGSNIPNIQLMGQLFGIFNQVALVVTIIIVAYTVFAGALNSAAEGKPLGEKWNAVWMPIRIVTGIALLVPKAGTGYCLAQYIVMWLILMGIGAADQLWGKMIDYFDAGGAVTVTTTEEKPLLFSYDNMNYTYSLQTDQPIGGGGYGEIKNQQADVMKSMVCVEAFNHDPANADASKRKAYLGSTLPTSDTRAYPILMFGDPKQYNSKLPINDNQTGAECGYIKYKINTELSNDEEKAKEPERATVYMNGLLLMANRLDTLATIIVTTTDRDDPKTFPKEYIDVQRAMQIYVQYVASYRNTLGPVRKQTDNLQLYKQFGWILAGNYYAVLSNFRTRAILLEQQFVLPVYELNYKGPISKDDPNGFYPRASSFYTKTYFTNKPDPMYAVPDSEYMRAQQANQPTSGSTISPITRSKAEKLKEDITSGVGSSGTNSVTQDRVNEFIQYLTGEGNTGSNLSSQNPIMNAAKYGKMLTGVAVVIMTVSGAVMIQTTASLANWAGQAPFALAIRGVISSMLSPLIIALGGFMYAQGAVLGVFIPLIPYVTFLTGVIGYMLQVVESIAAAPLVCMGLIFPETKDEIWGRAAPAYMLMLNLWLRPSLMIIGFAAAMILMWIMTEILNIGFLALMGAAFQVENMFGFMSIVTVYVTIFTYIVTEVYSLINVVPNRVLAWIGDQSMGVKGAKEALGAAKQGTEAGAGAAVGGLEAAQKADMWRAQEHIGENLVTEKLLEVGKDPKDNAARADMRAQIERERGGGYSETNRPH
ncbi:MAG: DotA/TraY family protein [Gammaproteobacteria bacterium]